MTATTRHKLAPRSTACVFLGYPSSHKGYRCLDMPTKRIIISRHVVFDETCFPFGLYSPRTPSSDLDFLLAGSAAPKHCIAVVAPLAVALPHVGVEQQHRSRAHLEELPDDPTILMRSPVIIPPTRRPAQSTVPAPSPTAATTTVAVPAAAGPEDVLFPVRPPVAFGCVYSRRARVDLPDCFFLPLPRRPLLQRHRRLLASL
jgi:hypothetical protein